MKILIDMNLTPDWCGVLQRHGHEAVHWSTVGDARAQDFEIMKWAAEQGYVVFTHDLDFGALLAAGGTSGPSVIQVRTEDTLPAQLEHIVLAVLDQHRAAIEAGAIIVVEQWRNRVRLLPLDR
jgi:predicted nuclease of predicted toxin-antitoxin system